MLCLKTLFVLNRAVTILLGYHQTPNRAVNQSYYNRAVFRAVEISVHYTALYRPPYCKVKRLPGVRTYLAKVRVFMIRRFACLCLVRAIFCFMNIIILAIRQCVA